VNIAGYSLPQNMYTCLSLILSSQTTRHVSMYNLLACHVRSVVCVISCFYYCWLSPWWCFLPDNKRFTYLLTYLLIHTEWHTSTWLNVYTSKLLLVKGSAEKYM